MKRVTSLMALAAIIAALCAGPAWAWSFVHITDLHIGEDPNGVAFEKMVNHIKSLSPQPDFVVATGDLVSDGLNSDGSINTANWTNLTRSIIKHPTQNMWYLKRTGSVPYNYNIPIYFTPGNHDSRSCLTTFGLAGYDQYIYNPKTPQGCTGGSGDAARDYYFVHYGALVISLYSGRDNGLNTSFPHSDGLKPAQRDFLNQAVKNNPSCKGLIIFMHHSAVDNQDNGLIDNNRTVFLDSLDKWSTRFKVLVLHGHIHGDAVLGRNGNAWTSGPVFVRTAPGKGDWYRRIDYDQITQSIKVYGSALTANPQPSSQIVTPGNGTNVGGTTVPIVVSVSSPVGIKSVNVAVNGTSLGTKTAGPWQWLWDLLGFKATNCNITATVTDNNNNVSTSTITVIKGAQTYYNTMNAVYGGPATVGVIDPKDGHSAQCKLYSVGLSGSTPYAAVSVDGLVHNVNTGQMARVNNGNSGLIIYVAAVSVSGNWAQVMIAPYQYPRLDILYPAPGQSTGTCVVRVVTNYSGKNVPWQGTGTAPTNADYLKTITYNGSYGYLPSYENYTWNPGGSAGSRTMTVNMTDKLGATVSKSVSVNYDPSIPWYAFYGTYGDYYKSLSISSYYSGGHTNAYLRLCYRPNTSGTTCDESAFNHHLPCYTLEQEIDRYAYLIAYYTTMWTTPAGVQVYVVDKNQYNTGSFSSGFGYGTITYKRLYDAVAVKMGLDSQGRYRVWASASAETRSPLDAIYGCWNPWDDDCVITTSELLTASNYWSTGTPINGHIITTQEMMLLSDQWSAGTACGKISSTDALDEKPALPVIPANNSIMLCAPNPFTGQTTINFQLVSPAQTTIKIYNINGQVVKTLVNECLRPGYHNVKWDGRDVNGNKVAAGVYLYRMQSGDYSKTNKLTVLR